MTFSPRDVFVQAELRSAEERSLAALAVVLIVPPLMVNVPMVEPSAAAGLAAGAAEPVVLACAAPPERAVAATATDRAVAARVRRMNM